MQTKSTIRLYNTMSREIEDFVPVEPGKVKLYACGPTVYDFAHIGHIRKYTMDDVLVRLLRYLNYQVTHVMNITDVGHLVSDSDTGEDKLEKGARREGKTAWEVAKFYEADFFKNMDAAGVRRPDIVCRATEHIKEQIELVKKLEEKGCTYTIADGVYFDSTTFPDYGKLARLNSNQQQAGARVEIVPGKKHPTDFALWKLTPSGQPFDSAQGKKRDMEWDSPWGKGFPGWHIECSAMSLKYLGNAFNSDGSINSERSRTIDVHTGGIDHIPIHHTNEIAQSEAATGKQFVKYWVHHNHLFVEGQKMSKSLGNFIRLEEIVEKGFHPLALRYLLLQTHYRQEANFTWEALASAQTALNQLGDYVTLIKKQSESGERSQLSDEKLEKVNILRKRFKDVIRMDLNTAQALGILWEIVKSNIPAGDKYDLIMIADEILGLGLKELSAISYQLSEVPDEIRDLQSKREELRKEKKFSEADGVRKEIEALGYIVEDTKDGIRVKKNEILNRGLKFHPERSRRTYTIKPGLIVLFGSGEMSPTGRKIHEDVIKESFYWTRVSFIPLRIGILETPTGFEVNAIHAWPERMQFFLEKGLRNYKPEICRIRAWRNEGEYSTNDLKIVSQLKNQDYIYAGAGSPSYAVTHLQNSLAFDELIAAHKRGAVLCLGSATAVSMSRFSLPVYEIFKAGRDLFWLDGLDLFSMYGLNLTIIPHWNNKEGEDFDTTRCWMGVARFEKLKTMLPKDTTILGIDEQTACIFDITKKAVKVAGIGSIHILQLGYKEKVYKTGSMFKMEELKY